MRRAHYDPVAQALDAIMRGDVDAQPVLDVLERRVLCNRSDRQLVDELRGLAIRIKRACGTLDASRKQPEQR